MWDAAGDIVHNIYDGYIVLSEMIGYAMREDVVFQR
jgi:hypothetical protein